MLPQVNSDGGVSGGGGTLWDRHRGKGGLWVKGGKGDSLTLLLATETARDQEQAAAAAERDEEQEQKEQQPQRLLRGGGGRGGRWRKQGDEEGTNCLVPATIDSSAGDLVRTRAGGGRATRRVARDGWGWVLVRITRQWRALPDPPECQRADKHETDEAGQDEK